MVFVDGAAVLAAGPQHQAGRAEVAEVAVLVDGAAGCPVGVEPAHMSLQRAVAHQGPDAPTPRDGGARANLSPRTPSHLVAGRAPGGRRVAGARDRARS